MGRRRDKQWVYNYLDPENGQNLVVMRWTSDGNEEEETKIFSKIANHKLMGDLYYWGKVRKSYFILVKVESPCVSKERTPVMDDKVLVKYREEARDEIEREHKVDVYVQAVIDRLRITEQTPLCRATTEEEDYVYRVANVAQGAFGVVAVYI